MGIELYHDTNPQKIIPHSLWFHHKNLMGRKKIQVLYYVWHICTWNSLVTSTPSYHVYNMENTHGMDCDINEPKYIFPTIPYMKIIISIAECTYL